jgi:hypothetical protein
LPDGQTRERELTPCEKGGCSHELEIPGRYAQVEAHDSRPAITAL